MAVASRGPDGGVNRILFVGGDRIEKRSHRTLSRLDRSGLATG
jgi:hypothetical protein